MEDRRREHRLNINVPIHFNGGHGIARNVSASGLFLETDHPLEVGAYLEMKFDIGAKPDNPTIVRCAGHVIRVQKLGGRSGVALAVRWNVDRNDAESTSAVQVFGPMY